METLFQKMCRITKPFDGAENCAENRAKLLTILRELTPELEDEVIMRAVHGILGPCSDR